MNLYSLSKYIAISALLLFLSSSCLKEQSQFAEKPNILFCISDDQSWVHTSYAGEKAISTPGFDRLAREGIYFSNAFCASPSCSPSRGSIITGQEMWRLGEAAQLFSAVPKELEASSFPLLLEKEGYFIGYTQKGWAPNDFKVHGWERNPLGKAFNEKKTEAPADKIVSNDYAGNFEEFLEERPGDKPFFFWFGSSEPHRAFELNSGIDNGIDPEEIRVPEFLPDIPEVRKDIADYLFEIQWVDQHLQEMIKTLEERKLLDNTIIIYTSDNGMAFPSAKNNLYEYGIHMPLAIRWPQGIAKGGRTIEDLVSLTDLGPTLLEVAGITPPEAMTGQSLLNIFKSSSSGRVDQKRGYVFSGKERHTICREFDLPYPQRSVRDYQFLYIRNLEPDRWPAGSPDEKSVHGWIFGDIDQSPTMSYLLEYQESKNVVPLFLKATAKRPYEELYDIVKDPYCLNNLAELGIYSEQKMRLSKVLDAYLLRTEDPRAVTGQSIWDNFPYYFDNPEGQVPYIKAIE